MNFEVLYDFLKRELLLFPTHHGQWGRAFLTDFNKKIKSVKKARPHCPLKVVPMVGLEPTWFPARF